MRKLFVTLTCLAALSGTAVSKTKPDRGKPPVYREVKTESSQDVELAMRRAYASKFTVVPVSRAAGFVPSKCTRRIVPTPQRDTRGRMLGGNIRVAFMITSEGRIVQPIILSSTNNALDPVVLSTMMSWRGTPARLNGAPVSCIEWQDFTFR